MWPSAGRCATELADLRRDLHLFVDYVRTREVKRSHRGEHIKQNRCEATCQALCRTRTRCTRWTKRAFRGGSISLIEVALQLGFVHYDTEGQYAGYTSQGPSFPDNYIKFQSKALRAVPGGQGRQARNDAPGIRLLKRGTGIGQRVLSRGACWGGWMDSTIGDRQSVSCPRSIFAAVRRFLLGLLAECPTGQWLSTAFAD